MGHDSAVALLELGAIVLVLAALARVAGRAGSSAVPLYLLAGLAVGEGGVLPLVTTRSFVAFGAELGVILLLFMLGLEYSARELLDGVRSTPLAGAVDLGLNATPGIVAGLALGWGALPAVLLGGITYLTSSGIVAKVLRDLGRERDPEVGLVVSILLIEDLSMAIYLPIMGALLAGGLAVAGLLWAGLAIVAVVGLLALALHLELGISRLLFSRNDEALLLSILGFALLLAGLAASVNVSAAVGALVAGILLSGPAERGARELLSPLRDLFAAIFFFFIGLSVDPATILPVLWAAVLLAVAGSVTKFWTGWWSSGRAGLDRAARARAGATLIPRGEISLAIAALATSADLDVPLAPLAVTYVLVLSLIAPVAIRFAGRQEVVAA